MGILRMTRRKIVFSVECSVLVAGTAGAAGGFQNSPAYAQERQLQWL